MHHTSPQRDTITALLNSERISQESIGLHRNHTSRVLCTKHITLPASMPPPPRKLLSPPPWHHPASQSCPTRQSCYMLIRLVHFCTQWKGQIWRPRLHYITVNQILPFLSQCTLYSGLWPNNVSLKMWILMLGKFLIFHNPLTQAGVNIEF